jgi:hypothetical protein
VDENHYTSNFPALVRLGPQVPRKDTPESRNPTTCIIPARNRYDHDHCSFLCQRIIPSSKIGISLPDTLHCVCKPPTLPNSNRNTQTPKRLNNAKMVFHTPINSTTTTTPTSFDKDFQLFHSNPDPTPPPKPSGIDPTHPESHNLPSLANMPKLELPSPRVSKAPDSKKTPSSLATVRTRLPSVRRSFGRTPRRDMRDLGI